jgi:iron-sulfur cluster assembly accessory protein
MNAHSPVNATQTITVTSRAAARIASILASEPQGSMLRVSVNGGGCSGFQYAFEIDQAAAEDDVVIDAGASRVIIDTTSLAYLSGSELDFVDDLMGQSFRIQNPHATASCGCGTSFAI